MAEKLFLTFKETAGMLGLSRSMIYKLVAAGDLQAVKIGHARRIVISSIHAFAAALAQLAP